MAQPSIQGRFIWEGLMTADTAAASSFYTKVLGWKAEPWSGGSGYTIFSGAGGALAGMTALTEEQRAQAVRPHWMVFIGAENVDATVASAEKLGAKVLRAAGDIDQVGRLAVVSDPQGASFAVFKPMPSSAPNAGTSPGEMAWQELATTDADAALRFYAELFGWQILRRMDMGSSGSYLVFGSAGVQRGGIYKLSHPAPGPYWLPYMSVPDADKAAALATKAGGRLLNGPMDVPGGGRIAQLTDPGGVAFAVHSMPKSVAAAPPASSQPKPAAKAAAPKAPPAPAAAPAKKEPQKAPAPAAAKKAARPAARKAAKKAAKTAAKSARKTAKKAARKAPKRKSAVKRKAGRKAAAGRRGSSARGRARTAAKSARRAGSTRRAARKRAPKRKK